MAITTVFWISTTIAALALALGGWSYFFHPPTIQGIGELGFPDFFRRELGVLQIAGACVLLLPAVPRPLKEWAYAGAVLFYVTAILAHAAHRDPLWITAVNVVLIANLALSNYALKQL
jgi:hypothetical protein